MKLATYEKQAKELWGETPAYKEYEGKARGRTSDDQSRIAADMMKIFCEFGQIKGQPADSGKAQNLVRKLQEKEPPNTLPRLSGFTVNKKSVT